MVNATQIGGDFLDSVISEDVQKLTSWIRDEGVFSSGRAHAEAQKLYRSRTCE